MYGLVVTLRATQQDVSFLLRLTRGPEAVAFSPGRSGFANEVESVPVGEILRNERAAASFYELSPVDTTRCSG